MHFSGVWSGDQGNCLYDPITCKVFHSRDVKFNEDEREIDPETDSNSEPVYHLVLDIPNDCEASSVDKPVEQLSAEPPLEQAKRLPDFDGNSES